MEDPAVASDGFTYERVSLQRWMTRSPTSPMTRQPFTHVALYPNMLLRTEIREWRERHPGQEKT